MTQDHPLYFSDQLFDSACLFNSLLHVIFNYHRTDTCVLDEFKEVDLKNMLTEKPALKEAYRNWIDLLKPYLDEGYYSTAYVFCQGKLWETDTLKERPRIVDRCNESNWVDCMQSELQKKFEIKDEPVSFWVVVEDRKLVYQKKLIGILYLKKQIENQLLQEQPDWKTMARKWEEEYSHALYSSTQHKRGLLLSKKLLAHVESFEQLPLAEQHKIRQMLADQQANPMDGWLQVHDSALRLYRHLGEEDELEEMEEKNDMRRQHNYIPFIKSFIQALHDEGCLESLSL
ncbi:hypothetical protein BY458DRAFT_548665 [Sporodiniella umbellata]|nr:hypothetical protein BY458DRAFT_548665 [Sporodiniella umbellata]